jgi:hypothetical protein
MSTAQAVALASLVLSMLLIDISAAMPVPRGSHASAPGPVALNVTNWKCIMFITGMRFICTVVIFWAAAHPDDVEACAGGLVAQLRQLGKEVGKFYVCFAMRNYCSFCLCAFLLVTIIRISGFLCYHHQWRQGLHEPGVHQLDLSSDRGCAPAGASFVALQS